MIYSIGIFEIFSFSSLQLHGEEHGNSPHNFFQCSVIERLHKDS